MARTDEKELAIRLEAKINDFERSMQRAQKTANNNFKRMQADADTTARRVQQSFAKAGAGIHGQFLTLGRTMGAAFAGAIGAGSVAAVAGYAAKFRDLQNALKVAGLEGDKLKGTFSQLSQISMQQGVPLDALVTLYSRASQAGATLNATNAELIQFSSGVATALRVAGTSATEAQGALLQLGQALASGRVSAEEFNSVNEGARPILQAVANGMVEAGGSVAKLRALVLDGKVSSEPSSPVPVLLKPQRPKRRAPCRNPSRASARP